ncbi:MAG: YqaJ viral recombinase family protein [Elusimicrobiota bacterium]|jgi:putative phage-type endonuclease|nr:YqaJ viral recombinase family protein [Elusimicrobiota bacterium]
MKREEWLEKRKIGISGTDASAIIGKNPYMTNQECWEYKVGIKKRENIDNTAMKYGREAEKYLLELFQLDYPQYEVQHQDYDLRVHKDYEFLLGSIDGELICKETGELGILEIKTTNILKSQHYEKWRNKVPDNYYIQVLHYLLITGYSYAIIKAQLKTNYENNIKLTTNHYFIKREEVKEDLEYLLEKELEFWKVNILGNKKPDLILPEI